MRTQIFSYKNVLGAVTDIENGVFLNAPTESGQLGCVVHTSEIDITKEAQVLIKSARREGGSFAAIMLTKHSDGSGSSIALFGAGKHAFVGDDLCIGRDCDLSVLDDCNVVDIEIPSEFIFFVDNM